MTAALLNSRSPQAQNAPELQPWRAPGNQHARHTYAVVLFRQNRVSEALEQTEILLEKDPGNLAVRKLATAILVRLR